MAHHNNLSILLYLSVKRTLEKSVIFFAERDAVPDAMERRNRVHKRMFYEYEVPTTTMKVENCDTQKKQNEC